jgi:hypothetical protein
MNNICRASNSVDVQIEDEEEPYEAARALDSDDVCRCFGPEGPSTEPTSEFYAACPSPDGLMQDETQGLSWFGLRGPFFQRREDEAYIILHQGACSRGYKLCERGNGSQVS